MNDTAIKNLLEVYNQQLEESRVLNMQSWALNYKCFEMLQNQKVKSKLNALVAIKIAAVVLGIIWVLFLGVLVYGNQLANLYFTVSVIVVMLFSVLAIAVYIKQIVLLKQIDYSESITDTQQKLAVLQLATIQIVRISFLQMPFYTTWFWSAKWMMSGTSFWLVSFPVTILFAILAIWLYKNISIKNINSKKGRWLMSGPEFSYIVKAKNFLDEIEDFRKDRIEIIEK